MQAVERDGEWHTTARTDGSVVGTYKAQELWDKVAEAAWACADPGVQFDDTIQHWHTCPDTDRINSSNPCSEYMFLDDSACNLSSLNLVKFLREDGSFDVEAYRHAARVLFTAQEILVDFSSYPTERIAKNSHDYRPLGLGYANLGTLLMIKGISYDSHEALAWTGALTAIMHGEAYRTSAEIAKAKGPFAGYAKNAQSMMRVMKQHQAALDNVEFDLLPNELMTSARGVWRETIEMGAEHGYRNAQATVLAPTGTIGLLMDCDTTGIEPDFALVKFKKLAGGGYFKIVNQSVPKALKNLGYTEKQIGEIVEYAVGTMSLENTPHINADMLKKKGANEVDLQRIASALPGAFDLNSAVAPWVIGDEGLARLGLTKDGLNGRTVLETLGFNEQQVKEASKVACGRMMLEGAPHLRAEHLNVFDCANKCGAEGTRFIEPMAHVRMMAAAQPFLSGAISKTVNLPHESTISDIQKIYNESWKLGLKAVAVYRDGSKMSQPLSGKADKKEKAEAGPAVNEAGEALLYSQKDLEEAVSRAVALVPAKKRKMPARRHGLTVEARVSGHQIFLRTGEYDDGRLGEIFIDMHKEGATLRSLLNCFAISVSMGLQYGVPLEDYVEKFTFTRFEPQGMVDHPNIKTATSILDYIFRVVGMEYLGKTDFVHVKPALDELAINFRQALIEAQNEARQAGAPQGQLDLPLEKAVVPRAGDGDDAGEIARANREAVAEGEGKYTKFTAADPLNAQLSKMMGDAPMCSTCGHVTVRNGSCYRCLNCGNSMGCS
jgi:ribonucleoside-diphosphate reductase alpha chain